MEHIPRAQPCSCLYVMSPCLQLPVAISTYIEDTRSIFAGKEELCCCSDFAAIFIYCLFLTLLISSLRCHHSINSHRAHALARAFRIWRMHMQIIAVGVTNRRDQTRSVI